MKSCIRILCLILLAANFVSVCGQFKSKVEAARALPFRLNEVRLLESPFKRAMELDAVVLLKIEPDRLLHNFRKNAGLAPKGKIYGGWEARGVAGHTLGHYLTAISMH